MKKIVVCMLAIIMLVASGCAGPVAGVSSVQKPDKSLQTNMHEADASVGNGQFTVLYIPLDNRPLNYDNVLSLAEIAGVQLITPPLEILGSPGENGGQDGPGDPDAVMQWLAENAHRADAWVVSLDMLLYGGLAPSRSHDRNRESVITDMQNLQQLLAENKRDVPVYAFATIMRSAASSASPKQPSYFGDYGDQILSLSKLWDMAERKEASTEQLVELERVRSEIPPEVLNNYLQRRETNLAAMRQAVHMVAGGAVDYLVLGRDDTTPYSFSRADLRRLDGDIQKRGLADRVDSYPGADELGALLLARAVNENRSWHPKVYVDWATLRGPYITALYEDVTLKENVRLHVKSGGGQVVDDPEEADLVLAVNSPVDKTVEAAMQPVDAAPSRHHRALTERINAWLEQDKSVALADVTYANGGDRALMEALAGYPSGDGNATSHINGTADQPAVVTQASSSLLPKLAGYAGCNTAGNSIGMALAHGLIYIPEASDSNIKAVDNSPGTSGSDTITDPAKKSIEGNNQKAAHREYLLARIVEDWGFQAVIRPDIIKTRLAGTLGAGTPLDKASKLQLEKEITNQLDGFLTKHFAPVHGNKRWATNVNLPWNRLFDISFTMECK